MDEPGAGPSETGAYFCRVEATTDHRNIMKIDNLTSHYCTHSAYRSHWE